MKKQKSVIIPKSEIMLKDDEILMASVLAEDFDEHVKSLKPKKTESGIFNEVSGNGKYRLDKVAFEIVGGYLAYMRDPRNSESRFYMFEPLQCASGKLLLGKSMNLGKIIYIEGEINTPEDTRNTMHLVGYNRDLEDGIYNLIRELYGKVNNAVITDLEQVADFWKVVEFAGLSGRK